MASTPLAAGDIALIGYGMKQRVVVTNPDGTTQTFETEDKLYFVLLTPILKDTQIFFTDRAWDGAAFAAASPGEGTYTYTASTDLPAGTVLAIPPGDLANAGIALGGGAGEVIYVYQGAIDAPVTFLHAAEIADGDSTFAASLANTGLVAGTTAVAIGYDSAAYTGPTTHAESFYWNGTSLLRSIGDATHWVGDDLDDVRPAKPQEVQTGPWLLHADVELWGTMGSGGLANTLSDGTVAGGLDDFDATRQYDGQVNGTTVFWYASDMVFDTVDGKFFVADSNPADGVNRILQGNIADLVAHPATLPALTVLFSDPLATATAAVTSLEVDDANNIVYFTHGSQLMKVGYGTANQAGTVLFDANAQVANPAGSSNNFFKDMAIDFAAGKVYLSSSNVRASASGDSVAKNFIYELSGLTGVSGAGAFTMGGSSPTARLLGFARNDVAYDPVAGTTYSPSTATNQNYFLAVEYGSVDGLAVDEATHSLYFSTGAILFDHDLDGDPADLVYAGGIVGKYAIPSNPTGTIDVLYQQTVRQGGVIPGVMGDLEIDTVAGRYYVLDYNGRNGPLDDSHWYTGSLATPGDPVQFTQTIGDLEGAATVGLTLNHAPTMQGQGIQGLVVAETGAGSGYEPNSIETASVPLFSISQIDDVDTSGPVEFTGAIVRIGTGLTRESASTAPGHRASVDSLTIFGATSGVHQGIAFAYDPVEGVMRMSNAGTAAQYKAVLGLVRFSSSGDNVTHDGTAPERLIYASVSDGLTMSDEIVARVVVTGKNDAAIFGTGGQVRVVEDSTANAIEGLWIADADADETSQAFVLTLSVSHGTLELCTDVPGGLTAAGVQGNGTDLIVLTGTQNEINATLAATLGGGQANGLLYTPNGNVNGVDALVLDILDEGNSGIGGIRVNRGELPILIEAVNDAPTVVGSGPVAMPAIYEDYQATGATAHALVEFFGDRFSDEKDLQSAGGQGSGPDSLAGVAVVGNGSGAAGSWQWLDGATWRDIGPASVSAAVTLAISTQVRFSPSPGFTGTAPALTVRLFETVETAEEFPLNGGTVDLTNSPLSGRAAIYTMDSVALTQLVMPSPRWTEGGGAVALDGGAIWTLPAIDQPHYGGGNLLVSFSAGRVIAQDRLGIASGGRVTLDGGNVSVDGALIGTLSRPGDGLQSLRFDFGDGATAERVTALLQALTYDNAGGDDPTDGVRTITWQLRDANGGADVLSLATPMDVDPVNDAPSGTPFVASMDEGTTFALLPAQFGFSDLADGDAFHRVVFTTVPAAAQGALLLDEDGAGSGAAVAVTAGQAVDVALLDGRLVFKPAAGVTGVDAASFTFQVVDDGGTADGGVDKDPTPRKFQFDVVDVNLPPTVLVGGPLDAEEQVGLSLKGAIDLGDADAGTGMLTLTLGVDEGRIDIEVGDSGATVEAGNGTAKVRVAGTLEQLRALLDGSTSTVTYTLDTDTPPASATLTVMLNDNGSTGDAPEEATDSGTIGIASINDAPAGTSGRVSGNENDAYIFVAADFGFTDVDGDAFAGVHIVTLPVRGELRLGGAIADAGDFVSIDDIVFGDLRFVPATNTSGTAYASFTFQVKDDGGSPGDDLDPTPDTLTIDIAPVNTAPELTLLASTGTIIEDGVVTARGGLSVSDPDIAGAGQTVTLSAAYNGDATWTGGPLSAAQVAALTQGITVDADSWDYMADTALQFLGVNESVTLSFKVTATDDSGAANDSDSEVVTITIQGVNDAPVITSDGSHAQGFLVEDGFIQGWSDGVTATDADQTDQPLGQHTWSLRSPAGQPYPHYFPTTYGTMFLAISQGIWSYDLDSALPATQALTEGQTVVERYIAVVTDPAGATAEQEITITITGANDAPVVSVGTSAGAVREAGNEDDGTVVPGTPSASGTLASDVDADAVLTWEMVEPQGTAYGSFDIGAGGTWTYTLDNTLAATQALKEGETITQVFSGRVKDEFGAYADQPASIELTIAGTNDAPVIVSGPGSDEGFVQEDRTFLRQGQFSVADPDQAGGGVWSLVGTPSTTYGTMSVSGPGLWTYRPNHALPAMQALKEGQTVVEWYTMRVTDEFGAYDDVPISITLFGVNDAPVVTNGAAARVGTVKEAGHEDDGTILPGTPAASGTLTASDVDVDATQTWSIVGPASAIYGAIAIDAGGTWTYTLDNTLPATQALKEGETVAQQVTARVTDEFGAFADQTLTITIVGTNDRPLITSSAADASGTVTEAGRLANDVAVAGTPVATGTLAVTDPDAGATATWALQGTPSTTYGAITLDAAGGTWTYTLDNQLAATQALKQGQVVTQVYTARATDEFGARVDQAITVTIRGTNDMPVITSTAADAAGTVIEAGWGAQGVPLPGVATTGGVLAATDDTDAVLTWQIAGSPAGQYGAVAIDPTSGAWTYTLDNALPATNALRGGQTVTEVFTAQVTDEFGVWATRDITVTVQGTNDAPVIVTGGVVAGAVIEAGHSDDGASAGGIDTFSGQLFATDVDGTVLTWSIAGTPGTAYGAMTIDPVTGAYVYTLDENAAATQALRDGQVVTEVYTLRVSDADGGFADQQVTITILGLNDMPEITSGAAAAQGRVVEAGHLDDGTPVAGTPLASDRLTVRDVDGLAPPTWHLAGLPAVPLGSFAIDAATGAWTFTLDNTLAATQALQEGEVVTQTYAVRAIDDAEARAEQAITITVVGTNDAPVLSAFTGPVAATRDGVEVAITLAQIAAHATATDVDGSVDSFVVTAVTSGSLRIGADAATATPWAAGSNDTLTATRLAFWTPAATGFSPDAFLVVARDDNGAVSSVARQVQVAPATNTAPTVAHALADMTATVREPLVVSLPADTFTDSEGGPLALTARLADGSPLPGWMSFDPATGSFAFLAPTGSHGARYDIDVTATDPGGLSTTTVLHLSVVDPTLHEVAGVVMDEGYFAGAALYVDHDGDNVADADEFTGLVTDASGRYAGTVSGYETLLAVGGTSLDTGLVNQLTLAAHDGAAVVSPVGTLIESLIDAHGLTAAQAATAVNAAFGLPGLPLPIYDPLVQPAGDPQALALQKVNSQLAILATLGGQQAFAGVANIVAAGLSVDLAQASTIAQALGGSGPAATTILRIAQGNAGVAEAAAKAEVAAIQLATLHDVTAPAVLSITPAAGVTNIGVAEPLVLRFSEGVVGGAGTIVLKTAAGEVVETFDVATSSRIAIAGKTLTIEPTAELVHGGAYRLEIPAGSIVDYAGNAYAGMASHGFTAIGLTINGTAGWDSLTGTAGDDTIVGFGGTDTVHFSGSLASYTLAKTAGGFMVSGPDGTDTLVGIERLDFTDLDVALDTDGTAGQAYRLYQAAFNRVPDIPGLGYQMHDLDVGIPLHIVAQNFVNSPEFGATYGALDNLHFVQQLYLNVLHREGEAEGVAYHLNRLALGATRGDILAGFSESPENQAAIIGAIENGMVYTFP